jgi:transposase, IS5 family
MLHHATGQMSFGEGFIPPELFTLNDELSAVDKLLADRKLLKPFEAIFSKTMGRPGTPVEVYVRMLYLKHRWDRSYEEIEAEVRERIPWRFFCHLSLLDEVPDATTLIKLNKRFGKRRVRKLNEMLVKQALKNGRRSVRKVRIDTTTIEANITYPTDVKLLHQVVSTVTRTVHKAGAKIVSHVRATKKAVARLGQSLKANAKDRKAQAQKALKQVHRYAQETVGEAQDVLARLKTAVSPAPVVPLLEKHLRLAERILEQTTQKLAGVTAIPERIVSFFDPEARPIRKGKLGKENEFGRTVALVQDKSGLFIHYELHHGNPNDKTLALPLTETVNETFASTVRDAALDKGFYSESNLAGFRALGVRHAAIPKVGRLTPAENRRQHTKWFRQAYRFRCGIEAGISMLKRCFSLSRSPSRNDEGTERWVGWSIVSFNLWKLARSRSG